MTGPDPSRVRLCPHAVAGVGVLVFGHELAGWHAVFLPRPALGRLPDYGPAAASTRTTISPPVM